MSWETRANGSRYYTRSRRVDGKIVREYVGAGTIGKLAARLDAFERAEQKRRHEAEQKAIRQDLELEKQIVAFDELGERIGHALQVQAGFRRHNRGEWRKRNESE